MDNRILIIEGISKRYGGLQALHNVHLDVQRGEVHAVVGENGAGKSTLMKILGGIVKRDSGKVYFRGQEVNFISPIEAIQAGLSVIHQELSMLPTMNVIENVYMGRMPSRFGRINWLTAEQDTRRVLAQVGLEIDPYTIVNDLSISQRQLVEIAKAISINASLIIMDEPNSSLAGAETERLFSVIESLKQQGVAIIYVSHKIEEVLRISDRITGLRDGEYVDTIRKAEASVEKIIRMMVGRELHRENIHVGHALGGVLLETRKLTGPHFADVSFTIRQGEIVGFAGLVGAGRSEVARAIFGADPFTSGEIVFEGQPVRFHSPAEAIAHGLAMVQEDRKKLSLFMGLPIAFNMALAEMPRQTMSRSGIINYANVTRILTEFVNKLNLKFGDFDDPVSSLSGGNQQKTVLARWLATKPRLLILDEPTHGIDVGAKVEIYKLMHQLSLEGIGILLISSELPEILLMSDRVVVMREGQVTGILNRSQLSEDVIMACATYNVHEITAAAA
ncbi:putative ribose/galactose/methyl galactoside import ATP-binding protein [Candidatus Vecturithrix granuli]|uniref:Putative ribose/galactose/methyl galactoside import ATP-binding protein n=1 Tax=Vecturithrix granuli TaxID=1499967 RepID=A0A081C7T8_VECG1|nr:putative ribose/galactose/methyl galactoside import ATP-binding protein [Candidatus Vecturithrix granuli]